VKNWGFEIAELTPEPAARVTTRAFDLRVWLVTAWSGEPTNAAPGEHDAIEWFELPLIRGLRLSDDRNVALIDQILSASDKRS
jgi:hypothetical protein